MITTNLLMTMALVLAPAAGAPSQSQARDAVIADCEVSSIEDQPVPSSDAGVLVKLIGKEGMRVTKDMEVARVDDREAQAQWVVKQREAEVAQQEADSDVNIRYNKVSADVARQAAAKLEEANRGQAGAVSAIEVLRAKLEFRKAELGTEKALQEQTSNKLSAEAKKAEAGAAEVGVNRRVLRAPFDGIVIKVYRHVGEWVSPGDPVMQIVRVDRLRIGGNLDANEWSPADVENRKVTVEVTLPQGRTEKVTGKIVFASPVVEGGQLPVTAEIESPMDNGRPVVRAGLRANMTIHVGQPAEPETKPLAQPKRKPAARAETSAK